MTDTTGTRRGDHPRRCRPRVLAPPVAVDARRDALAAALAARVAVGDWQLTDALVPVAVMLAVFPFFEWMIHVFVLHWRPRRLGRLTVDPLLARKHREHHVDPRDVPLVFIPLAVADRRAGLARRSSRCWPFRGSGLGLTFLVTILALRLGLRVVPLPHPHRLQAENALSTGSIWRNHRQHHFKNEHYWFTVTTPGTADRVLRHLPGPGRGADIADGEEPARRGGAVS